jgi:hypothetical protein
MFKSNEWISVIAATTAEVILNEELADSESWSETFQALLNFSKRRARVTLFELFSWGLNAWSNWGIFIYVSEVVSSWYMWLFEPSDAVSI